MIGRLLNKKNTKYTSTLSQEDLKQKIEDVFEKKSTTIVGKFTSQNEFTAYDKWTLIAWQMPNLKRKSAYLTGELVKAGDGTSININIKPNTILSIVAIGAVFLGILTALAGAMNKESNQFLILGIIFTVVGIIYFSLGLFLTNRLRNNIEKYLDLKKPLKH